METMERQLAGLSNLVHTALVSKGMSETTQKDMAELRREVRINFCVYFLKHETHFASLTSLASRKSRISKNV